jgi:hypothetical protein
MVHGLGEKGEPGERVWYGGGGENVGMITAPPAKRRQLEASGIGEQISFTLKLLHQNCNHTFFYLCILPYTDINNRTLHIALHVSDAMSDDLVFKNGIAET